MVAASFKDAQKGLFKPVPSHGDCDIGGGRSGYLLQCLGYVEMGTGSVQVGRTERQTGVESEKRLSPSLRSILEGWIPNTANSCL